MVMWYAKSGTNVCLFCRSRALFRPQLENFDLRSYSVSQKLNRGGNQSAVVSHRKKGSRRQSVAKGRDKSRLEHTSAKEIPFKPSREIQWTGKPFRNNGRISGSRHGEDEAYRPYKILRFSGKDPIEDAGRKILEQMYSSINDPAFRLETGLVENDGEDIVLDFGRAMQHILGTDSRAPSFSRIKSSLVQAYHLRGEKGLASQLKFMLQARLVNRRFEQSEILNQMVLADFRHPAEWYPLARKRNRTIHLHIGPTNSGKTYHALKRLEEAKTGCYAGPLRLLAHEVYTRLKAKGMNCNLVTGDEIVIDETSKEKISSCTVEMAPINTDLDVAVIDEIQMLGDSERGWAWTRALLGIRAKELHLCGETRTLPLIREIAASLGEELIVHNYERLSPLKVASESLGGRLDNLQKGDCVISFSRKGIHGLQKEIHGSTGKNVAIVYGSLPPETRAQQAALFNDPNNTYDILVASDAIGMGLNLNIKRIIFETVEKFNGVNTKPIDVPHIKQIGGRAGRYRTAAAAIALDSSTVEKNQDIDSTIVPVEPSDTTGYVTTLHNIDLPRVRSAMSQDPPAIKAAGLKVPDEIITRFASYFPPQTPLAYILLRLQEIARINPRYFICDIQSQIRIADAIQSVPGLTIHERLLFCYSPVNTKDSQRRATLIALATCVANRSGGNLIDIPALGIEVLDKPIPPPAEIEEYIMALANAHHAVVLYLWLSYRLNSVFRSQALAFYTKNLLQEKLEEVLEQASLSRQWFQERSEKIAAAKGLKLSRAGKKGDAAKIHKHLHTEESVGSQGVAGQDVSSVLPVTTTFIPPKFTERKSMEI